MDQRSQYHELSYLKHLQPCNSSDPSSSFYNFSPATARDLILEYQDDMLTLTAPITVVLMCLYIIIFVVALVGNLLVIHVVFCNLHMRRVRNFFLVNLAIADVFVTLLCFPMVTGQTVYRLWIYGDFMCKLSGYIQGLAVTCSIFTLAALSVDRYLAIKTPTFIKHLRGEPMAIGVVAIIWLLSGVFAGPLLYIRNVHTMEFKCLNVAFSYCIEEWPSDRNRAIYSILVLVIIYVLPLTVIAISYGLIGKALCSDEFHRKSSDGSATTILGRRRVARMLIVLIVLFVICWLPYNACSLTLDLKLFDTSLTTVFPFTLWLGYAHSALNPILYWLMNKSFRHSMRNALCCRQSDKPKSSKALRVKHNRKQKKPCNV